MKMNSLSIVKLKAMSPREEMIEFVKTVFAAVSDCAADSLEVFTINGRKYGSVEIAYAPGVPRNGLSICVYRDTHGKMRFYMMFTFRRTPEEVAIRAESMITSQERYDASQGR